MKVLFVYFSVFLLSIFISRIVFESIYLKKEGVVLGYIYTASSTPSIDMSSQTIITPLPTSSPTPTLTPTPTNLPTPTNSPTPSPVPSPTPIPIPTISSQEINELIDRFAGQYGVSPHEIRHIAICESGFRPDAINGPYAGLFQFGSNTWRTNRMIMGEDPDPDLRVNAEEAIQTASFLYSKGKGDIWPNCQP